MTLISYKAGAALLIFFVSLATAIYPLKKRKDGLQSEKFALSEAIASGIFLGAAFFHMLPDAIKTFHAAYGNTVYPIPELICILGFLFFLFLERLSLISTSLHSKQTLPLLLTLTLMIHGIIEGMALGISITLSETLLILIAIMAHKGSESFALCIALLRYQLPVRQIAIIIALFALMTPIGISIGAVINEMSTTHNDVLLAALVNAFAAGTFLYISTLHHIHFHKHANEKQGLIEFSCLVLGVATMAVIALWT